MAEVAEAGKDHRHIALVGGGDDFGVAHGAARLNGAGRARVGRGDQSIGKWEKCVARDGAAVKREARLVRFPNCDARSINARHLAGADAESAIAVRHKQSHLISRA